MKGKTALIPAIENGQGADDAATLPAESI